MVSAIAGLLGGSLGMGVARTIVATVLSGGRCCCPRRAGRRSDDLRSAFGYVRQVFAHGRI